jgi:hypothetical protein
MISFRMIVISLGVAVVLCGCVSEASVNALNSYVAACKAGDQNACIAASNQAAANQVEYQTNAAIGYGLLGAALEGAAAGAAEGLIAPRPVYYAPVYYHR